MTIEGMNAVIQEQCEGECEFCSIERQCDRCYGDFEGHPKECEEAYKILMGIRDEKHDVVNHPSHYTNGGMECIDEMILIFGREATANFCLLNAWKYRKRALYKNGQEDMDKSDWYIAKFKELTEYD